MFLALALGWIVLLHAAFNPLWQGDSVGYSAPGCMLLGPYSVRLYDGARTPLYPLFLSVLQHAYSGKCLLEPEPGALALITGVQLLLYLAAIVYVYRALSDFGVLVRLAGMAAIASSPLHALFTRQILTEALAAPLLLLFAAHLIRFTLRGRSERDAAVSFAAFTLLALTRPNVLLPLSLAVPFVLWLGRDRRRLLASAGLLIVLPLLVVASLNYANRGFFTLTNIGGFTKTGVVYNLFDRVHEEDAILGSILSAQHQLDVRNGQVDGLLVWRAMAQVQAAIDRMPYTKRHPRSAGTSDLNAYLAKVSDYLMRENPGVVARNAWRSLVQLYDLGVLAIPPHGEDPRSPGHDGNIRSAALYRLYEGAQPAYNAIMRLLLAVVPILIVAGSYLRGPRHFALPLLFYAIYLSNLAMIAVFNVIHNRYLVLMQPLLIMALCVSLQAVLRREAAPREEPEAVALA